MEKEVNVLKKKNVEIRNSHYETMEKMRKENDTVKKELEKVKKEHSELLKSASILESIEANLRKEINIHE